MKGPLPAEEYKVQIAARIKRRDRKKLERMARKKNKGISTYAGMVLEAHADGNLVWREAEKEQV